MAQETLTCDSRVTVFSAAPPPHPHVYLGVWATLHVNFALEPLFEKGPHGSHISHCP